MCVSVCVCVCVCVGVCVCVVVEVEDVHSVRFVSRLSSVNRQTL